MRITKFIGTNSFTEKMLQKFKLQRYREEFHEPLVVRGCTNMRKKKMIMRHQGFCVISWGGSDTLFLESYLPFIEYLKQNEDRIFHVAFSHWCKTDLEHFDIPYIHRLIYPGEVSHFPYEPKTKGEVYHYGSAKKPWYYGTDLVQEIERKWDAYHTIENPEFIYTFHGKYGLADLQSLYKDAIVGVRLTEHDGIANSVLEMGLMGRRSIYNDPQIPSAIPYMENPYTEYSPRVFKKWCYQKGDLVQIVGDLIEEELNERPMPDKTLAEEMKEFTHDDLAWLDTKFYTG